MFFIVALLSVRILFAGEDFWWRLRRATFFGGRHLEATPIVAGLPPVEGRAAVVAPIANRPAVPGIRSVASGGAACRVPLGDTADWQSALLPKWWLGVRPSFGCGLAALRPLRPLREAQAQFNHDGEGWLMVCVRAPREAKAVSRSACHRTPYDTRLLASIPTAFACQEQTFRMNRIFDRRVAMSAARQCRKRISRDASTPRAPLHFCSASQSRRPDPKHLLSVRAGWERLTPTFLRASVSATRRQLPTAEGLPR